MSDQQKNIIIAGVCALTFLTVIVPWTTTWGEREIAGEYGLIFAPPGGARLDVARTVIPMSAVVLATLAGVVATRPLSSGGTAYLPEFGASEEGNGKLGIPGRTA